MQIKKLETALGRPVLLRGPRHLEVTPAGAELLSYARRVLDLQAEAHAARRAVPEDAASINAKPETPAEHPTESDEEMFEFYQPDDVLMLEDLLADDGGTDPETEVDRHDIAMALHRAIADLAPVERRVLYRMYLEDATIAETAVLFGLTETEVAEIAENAGATLRARLAETGLVRDPSGRASIEREIAHTQRLPQPIEDRRRVAAALTGEEAGSDT